MWPKLVGINRDGGTNLARCKATLESNFDNTGVFDSVNPMFVMGCLAHFLYNACKAGLMDMKSDVGMVDTYVTSRNTQLCITWNKNHKREQRLWRQLRSMWDFLVRGLLHLSKIVLPI